MLVATKKYLVAWGRQQEESNEELRVAKVALADLENELLQTRTSCFNQVTDINSLKIQLEEAQAGVLAYQATIARLAAARERLTPDNEPLVADLQRQPPPPADNPTANLPASDKLADCPKCTVVKAKLGTLAHVFREVGNDANIYKERFLQMEEWEQRLVRDRDR